MRPKALWIGNIPFKVEYVEKVSDNDDYGETDGHERKIRIKAALKGLTLHRTIAHEALHAALHVSGQTELMSDRQEEALVVALENLLAHCFDIKKLSKRESAQKLLDK